MPDDETGDPLATDAMPAVLAATLALAGFFAALGVSVWGGFARAGADYPFELREAWDVGAYYWLALPAMVAAVGVAAFLVPRRVWRWPAALFAGHFVAVALIGVARGASLGLLPFTLVLLFILAFLFYVPALLGGWIGRRAGRA